MINLFLVLFGLTMLYMAATSRINAHIKMLSIQGLLLFFIISLAPEKSNFINFLFLSIETIIVKAGAIPLFLNKVSRQSNLVRDNDPHIPNFYSMVIASLILFGGFIIPNLHNYFPKNITVLYFGVSISTILISLFFITTKRKLLTHVIGFAMLENGIFLLSLSVAKEMPIIVNMGVLLDVFIAVFILGLLIGNINTIFEKSDSCILCNLKDCEYND